MPLILAIDTSTQRASIALSRAGEPLALLVNKDQKDHAAWIHEAIGNALASIGAGLRDLQAIGITAGPGSYTGLRVGLATAKGLCYALALPLITVNTLEAMAVAAVKEEADLYCPMIDARRMEVFTALYNRQLQEVMPPRAMVLEENTFGPVLDAHRIIFFGDGHTKLKQIISHPHAVFSNIAFDASKFSTFITKKYNLSEFSDLTYTEPVYVKEFYTNALKK